MVQGLNSFRFFAFFAVFLFHLDFFEFGYMGVHAFFVLSGFLLTPIILQMNEHLPTKQYFINFYGRRSLRIFPLYFFYLIAISLIAYIAIEHFDYDVNDRLKRALDQMVYAATYTYNFFAMSSSYEQTQTITHFWSLAVEEQFYLIWPLVIYLLHKTTIKRALIVIIVSGPIIRFLLAQLVLADTNNSFNSVEMVVYSFTLSSFDAFAIGGYFALYGKQTNNFIILGLFILLVVIGLAMDYVAGNGIDIRSFGYADFMKNDYKYVWAFSIFSLLFAMILVNIREKVFLPFVFENGIVAYLGKISYGLYVYHFPLVYFMTHELSHLSFYLRAPIILLTTIAIAALSYHLLEKRFLEAKDKYFPH